MTSHDGEATVTVHLGLGDARALSVFARMGLVWVLRERRIGADTHHGLGRGLHSLNAAIEQAVVRPTQTGGA